MARQAPLVIGSILGRSESYLNAAGKNKFSVCIMVRDKIYLINSFHCIVSHRLHRDNINKEETRKSVVLSDAFAQQISTCSLLLLLSATVARVPIKGCVQPTRPFFHMLTVVYHYLICIGHTHAAHGSPHFIANFDQTRSGIYLTQLYCFLFDVKKTSFIYVHCSDASPCIFS